MSLTSAPKSNELVRLEYYTTMLFSGQDIHGKDKDYNDLKETYQIAIIAAVKTMADFTQNEIEYIRKMSLLKAELDYQDGMVTAKRKGHAEGHAEGYAEGLAEGRSEANLENARKMKAMGFLIEQIQTVTGLSPEIIAQL